MIEKDYVYKLISEMAQRDGVSAREFVENLYEGRIYPSYESLDENALAEIQQSRKQQAKNRYDSFLQSMIDADIAEFTRVFPNVKADAIPQEVWDAVTEGRPLAAAYALYTIENDRLKARADDVNSKNSARSAVLPNERDSEELLTEKQVAAMKPSEIKRNYKRILKSMRKWK